MRRARWPWLVAAAALLGLAAWLMALRDVERPPPAWTRVELPRRMSHEDLSRAQRRRTLAALPVAAQTEESPAPARPRDPVIAALPSSVKQAVIVVEANAIRHSPVGRLLVDCALSGEGGRNLEELRRETGIDPLEDIDRIAIADETVIVSGHFTKARWNELFADSGMPVGADGVLFRPRHPDGTPEAGIGVGAWKGQLLVVAPSENAVRETLARLEGRGAPDPAPLDESQTYGEIYGVANAAAIAQLVPPEYAALAEKLRSAASRVELHVDASRDVGIVADVTGLAAQDTQDLGKSIGAALALGRLRAQAEGEDALAELMELARVIPAKDRFRLEMGLPLEVLEKHLRRCVENNERARAQSQHPIH